MNHSILIHSTACRFILHAAVGPEQGVYRKFELLVVHVTVTALSSPAVAYPRLPTGNTKPAGLDIDALFLLH